MSIYSESLPMEDEIESSFFKAYECQYELYYAMSQYYYEGRLVTKCGHFMELSVRKLGRIDGIVLRVIGDLYENCEDPILWTMAANILDKLERDFLSETVKSKQKNNAKSRFKRLLNNWKTYCPSMYRILMKIDKTHQLIIKMEIGKTFEQDWLRYLFPNGRDKQEHYSIEDFRYRDFEYEVRMLSEMGMNAEKICESANNTIFEEADNLPWLWENRMVFYTILLKNLTEDRVLALMNRKIIGKEDIKALVKRLRNDRPEIVPLLIYFIHQ